MQIAFLLYDGFTPLDTVGPYQVLAAVPGIEPVLVAEEPGPVRSDSQCTVIAERSLADTPSPEVVLVPGSLTSFTEMCEREPVLDWLRDVHRHTRFTTSVCTGSLVLAAAGLLEGLTATTHWAARDLLASYDVEVVTERVVDTGHVITAGGVSAGIDMALHMVQRMHGDDVASAVQLGIEYDPAPPLDSGRKETADEHIVAAVLAGLSARGAGWLPERHASTGP